jgi:hypothetical protein
VHADNLVEAAAAEPNNLIRIVVINNESVMFAPWAMPFLFKRSN